MTRRTLLAIAAVAVLIALAGCGDTFSEPAAEFGEDDATDNGSPAGGDDTADESDGDAMDNESAPDNATDSGDSALAETDETADTSEGDDADDQDTAENRDDTGGQDTADEQDESDADDQAGDDTGNRDDDQREQQDDGDGDQEDDDDDVDGEIAEPDQSPLTVTVIGPASEPITGASVSGEGDEHEADIPLTFDGATDVSETYTATIYENTYAITVDHPDYDAETVRYDHDGEGEPEVELDPTGTDGSAPETALLTLRVVDSDGEPIEGASVSGQGEPHEADIPLTFAGETAPTASTRTSSTRTSIRSRSTTPTTKPRQSTARTTARPSARLKPRPKTSLH